MDPKLQRRVQRYGWDRASETYEQYWGRQLEPAQNLLLNMAAIAPGEHVLDIACGTGLVTFPAAQTTGPAGRVLATDLSDRMVESVRTQAAERKLPHVTSERMDAEDLKCPEESFDVALNSLGLMYVPFPLKSLQEKHRVLRPGGRAVAAVWGARKNCGWSAIFTIVDARVKTDVCPMFFLLGTGDSLPEVFAEAGFREVESQRIQTMLHYDNAEDACGAAFIGGPVAMAYSRFDPPTREEAHREYIESIAPYQNSNGYDIPGEFVVVRGIK